MANLREAVKDIILSEIDGLNKEEAIYWFDNPNEYSCVNGCIGDLIYYSDTEAFTREHHDEIVELMKEFGAEPMSANDMAWFGFEATVPNLKDEIIDEEYMSDDEIDEIDLDGITEKMSEIFDEAKENKATDEQLTTLLERIVDLAEDFKLDRA